MLNQQDTNGCDVYEGEKGRVKLIVSCKYPTKPLELLEEAFDQAALFVGVIINGPRLGIIALGRDGIACLLSCDIRADGLCTIGLVSKDVACLNIDPLK